MANNLKVFDEAGLNVLTDSDYNSNGQRQNGTQADQPISSALYNTTLRSLTSIMKSLVDVLMTNSSNPQQTIDTNSTLEEINTALDNLVKGLSVDKAAKLKVLRDFKITDYSSANSGQIVQFDGSGNVTLKLPQDIVFREITGALIGGCSGNAGTATKLANSRGISISNYDGTFASTNVYFDGSGNVVLKLPQHIKATQFVGALTGNADTATNATQAGKADKLATARNIKIASSDGTFQGTSVAFDGSGDIILKLPSVIKATLQGNATTATKLANVRTITLADADSQNVSVPVDFDGSRNIMLNLPDEIEANAFHGIADNALCIYSRTPTYSPAFTQYSDKLLSCNITLSNGTYIAKIKVNASTHDYRILTAVLTVDMVSGTITQCQASAYYSTNDKYVLTYIAASGYGELQVSIDSVQGSASPYKANINVSKVTVDLYKIHN